MRSYKKERAEHVFVSESAATAAQKEQLQCGKVLLFLLLRPLLRIKRLSWFDYAFIVFLGSLTLYNDEVKLGPHQNIFGVCSQLVALIILSLSCKYILVRLDLNWKLKFT